MNLISENNETSDLGHFILVKNGGFLSLKTQHVLNSPSESSEISEVILYMDFLFGQSIHIVSYFYKIKKNRTSMETKGCCFQF